MLVRALLAALAYFVGARLGYALAIPHGLVTLWPPSGIMLGLLLLSARSEWPAVVAGGMVGSVASDSLSHYSPSLAIAAAAANNLESFVAAWLITRQLGERVRLTTGRAVEVFIIAGPLLANAATAALGALVLHEGYQSGWGAAWLTWWVGDGL